eukprot:12912251-Prorocentrum_lima.AAC.1
MPWLATASATVLLNLTESLRGASYTVPNTLSRRRLRNAISKSFPSGLPGRMVGVLGVLPCLE